MSIRFVITGAALLALTACGGGGDGGTGVDLGAGPAGFDGLIAETERLTSYFSSTPTSTLPTNDTATYNGVIVIGQDLTADATPVSATGYIGQVAIAVDFGASDANLSGTANNFFSTNLKTNGDPDTRIADLPENSDNELAFVGSGITGNNFVFTADGALEGVTVDGDMVGAFALSSARALIARENGTDFLVGGDSWDARLAADDRSR
ncbi:hypothetical protein GQ651_07795 [Alphaproteobacteria bacterium GH1-50]|uniref:Transferrin-binding protein B C-lobe/N-lobe beta barrel domain-containing protein n=1 Tax=Kangsaoukella pontilimi TaxID=2691042 RepID=A0A7C9IRP3_9RHOB|nr:transferrin-binding protein-like solute binding protein [Kangsaoukella pontilimi]MXQ07746.1 hypothetical protein [Kangsaoukella pontilimi]